MRPLAPVDFNCPSWTPVEGSQGVGSLPRDGHSACRSTSGPSTQDSVWLPWGQMGGGRQGLGCSKVQAEHPMGTKR